MYYCGLDVSLRLTSICILDREGKIVKEVKAASDPDAIGAVLRGTGLSFERVGLEAGSDVVVACRRPARAGLADRLHRRAACFGLVAGRLP